MFGTPTHLNLQTGVLVKHRETQISSPPGQSLKSAVLPISPAPAMSSVSGKPIPAPRRKAVDNSLTAKSSTNNALESDDEIVEIRFDEDSHLPSMRKPSNCVIGSRTSGIESKPNSSSRTARLKRNGRSISVDVDMKTANIKRSMDELRKREEDENEITKDLERQLAEIRKLEERQRNILQNTLRQVVHSVNDSQRSNCTQAAASYKDEIPMDRIDYSSLLSPSFNRKTPLSSPLLTHRTASPQSSRKLSSAGRRQDMQTINENGGYSLMELAAMSPASSHRTLSSMASPLLPHNRPDYAPSTSHSLPPRGDRMASTVSASLADPFLEKNFRLSASYTELPPQMGDGGDRSGYFSDRETDRRRGGEDMNEYTAEARRGLLQFEIEKRRTQVEENNQLRTELQRLIQSGSIPAAKYDRLRDMYREHINRSREYLGLSSSSLSSISTGRNVRTGGYDGYTTDSDFMSSTEQLTGNISQSSTVERFVQSNDSLYSKQSVASKSPTSAASSTAAPASLSSVCGAPHRLNTSVTADSSLSSTRQGSDIRRLGQSAMPAMPLLDIRAPKSSTAVPNPTCELVKIGKIAMVLVSE